MTFLKHPIARTLLAGTLLGSLVLGAGGRVAMAAVTALAGGTPRFTLGGTLTVIALGAASGLAGATLALLSRWVARRLLPRAQWTQYVLFAALLVLVTMRGLRGTPQRGSGYFYALVAVFGVALALTMRRSAQSQRPMPRDSA